KGKKAIRRLNLPVHSDSPLPTVAEKSLYQDTATLEFENTVKVRDILDGDLVYVCDNKSFAETGFLPLTISDTGDPNATVKTHLIKLFDGHILECCTVERVAYLAWFYC